MSDLLQNPTFWVVAAFFGFMAILAKLGLHKKLTGALDNRADSIKSELDAARKLRVEAEAVLAEYKQKQAEQMKEAETMLENARKEADALRKNAEEALLLQMDARMQATMDRIDQQEQQALNDVRDHIVDLTITAAKELISEHFDGLSSDEMIQSVISDLDRKVH